MTISLQTIQMGLESDRDGRLVLADGALIAVLVRLSSDYPDARIHGSWFVESAYGFCEAAHGRIFDTLDDATCWFDRAHTGAELVRRNDRPPTAHRAEKPAPVFGKTANQRRDRGA